MYNIVFIIMILFGNITYGTEKSLLHVSYDATRELYQEINKGFVSFFNEKINIKQSHAGSSKQTQAISNGLEADIVSLASNHDIEILVKKNIIHGNWENIYPNNSCPSKSTIVFLVRKNNPKNILDWDDLIKENISIITPNPKTSGGAKWNYIAAWHWGLKNNQEEEAKLFVTRLYKNVQILDSAARASTISFVHRNQGDVLIAWENEAYQAIDQFGSDKFEIIYPSRNIEIDLPVVALDKFIDKHNTREIAKQYIEYLYSEEGQRTIIKHHFRPFKLHNSKFPNIVKFSNLDINDKFYHKHFDNEGIFDQIYENK